MHWTHGRRRRYRAIEEVLPCSTTRSCPARSSATAPTSACGSPTAPTEARSPARPSPRSPRSSASSTSSTRRPARRLNPSPSCADSAPRRAPSPTTASLHADAVVHVAAPTAQPVSDFCAEATRLLGAAMRIRVLGGVVRPRTYTGGGHEQLRLRASGRAAARTPHAERVPDPDEQDGRVVGEGLDGAPHVLPAALRRRRPDEERGPRARLGGRRSPACSGAPTRVRPSRRPRARTTSSPTSSAPTPTCRRSTRSAPACATWPGIRSGNSCARARRGMAGGLRPGPISSPSERDERRGRAARRSAEPIRSPR